jgi:hypothetical protein
VWNTSVSELEAKKDQLKEFREKHNMVNFDHRMLNFKMVME